MKRPPEVPKATPITEDEWRAALEDSTHRPEGTKTTLELMEIWGCGRRKARTNIDGLIREGKAELVGRISSSVGGTQNIYRLVKAQSK